LWLDHDGGEINLGGSLDDDKPFPDVPIRGDGIAASAERPAGFVDRLRNLVAAIEQPFPPSTNDPRILGADVSHFNGLMDFDNFAGYDSPKFEFIIIRSGQSSNSNWDDSQFLRNWQVAKSVGLPRMVYHALFPAQQVEPQVAHFMSLMDKAGDFGEGPIWLDVELHQNQSKRRVSDATQEWLQGVTQRSGHRAGVYTGKWFTDQFMQFQDWWPETDWWLATYFWPNQQAEHPGPPGLPQGVPLKACKFHQTTSFGDGKLVGAQSARIDLNRWVGSREAFNAYLGIDPPPPPQDDLEARVAANARAIVELRDTVEKLVEWAEEQGFNGDA
jgi:lysozyme